MWPDEYAAVQTTGRPHRPNGAIDSLGWLGVVCAVVRVSERPRATGEYALPLGLLRRRLSCDTHGHSTVGTWK